MKESNKKRSASSPAARRFATPVAVALLFVLAAGGFWWSKHRQPDVAPVVAPTSQTTNTSVSSEALSSFEKLKGRWLRAEGSYIIEVRSVEASGKMNAAYFNPRPINVAKAEAMNVGGNLGVFVELRDVNYPGSTYWSSLLLRLRHSRRSPTSSSSGATISAIGTSALTTRE